MMAAICLLLNLSASCTVISIVLDPVYNLNLALSVSKGSWVEDVMVKVPAKLPSFHQECLSRFDEIEYYLGDRLDAFARMDVELKLFLFIFALDIELTALRDKIFRSMFLTKGRLSEAEVLQLATQGSILIDLLMSKLPVKLKAFRGWLLEKINLFVAPHIHAWVQVNEDVVRTSETTALPESFTVDGLSSYVEMMNRLELEVLIVEPLNTQPIEFITRPDFVQNK